MTSRPPLPPARAARHRPNDRIALKLEAGSPGRGYRQRLTPSSSDTAPEDAAGLAASNWDMDRDSVRRLEVRAGSQNAVRNPEAASAFWRDPTRPAASRNNL